MVNFLLDRITSQVNTVELVRRYMQFEADLNLPEVYGNKNLDYLNLIVPGKYATSSFITGRLEFSQISYNPYEFLLQSHRERLRIVGKYDIQDPLMTEGMFIIFKYIHRAFRVPINEFKRLLFKSSAVELYLCAGNLFDELFDRVMNGDDKPREMKSALRLIDRMQYCHFLDPFLLLKKMERYLILTETIPELSHFTKPLLKLFFKDDAKDAMKHALLRIPVSAFKMLVDISQRERFNIFSSWDDQGHPPNFRFLWKYIYHPQYFSPEHFIYLLKAGKTSVPDEDALKSLRSEFYFPFQPGDGPKSNVRIEYHCIQVRKIFESFQHKGQIFMEVLKYLWISLPDPFLTTVDFHLNFPCGADPESKLFQYHMKMQKWYTTTLNLSQDRMDMPRTLKHLSRCIIRQKLAMNFQLPHLTENLKIIPKPLKEYLTFSCLENNK